MYGAIVRDIAGSHSEFKEFNHKEFELFHPGAFSNGRNLQ
jgi:hypothetical protein